MDPDIPESRCRLMKKEAKLLKAKATSSLVLAVEHFNSLSDTGRTDVVLMLLDHSFEMLLKAAIVHRGGRIRDPGSKNTIGFDACVRRCLSDARISFLTEEQTLTLQTINGLRDAAQHHLVELSEGHLYLHAQSGITLFRDLLRCVFEEELSNSLPARTLPISTVAQLDPIALFVDEVEEVKRLLQPQRRRATEATARLRPLAILDGTIRGEKLQPGVGDLSVLGRRIAAGEDFEAVFPGISAVEFTTEGSGPSLTLRLSKKEGIPVHLVPEGTDGAAVVGVKRVNELDFYSLGHNELAKKLGITPNKATAAIWDQHIQQSEDFFREIKIGSSKFKRYSVKALQHLQVAIAADGIEAIWERYRADQGHASKRTPPVASSSAA
jgi:hypothetical protein